MHFMRNVLAHVTRADQPLVAAALRTICAQPDRASAGQQLGLVADKMAERWPRAAELLRDAEEDVLAHMAFPQEHWSRIYSTNPLERLNIAQHPEGKEMKRRTHVVGIFPDVPSVERLRQSPAAGAVLIEIHDEWRSACHAAGPQVL